MSIKVIIYFCLFIQTYIYTDFILLIYFVHVYYILQQIPETYSVFCALHSLNAPTQSIHSDAFIIILKLIKYISRVIQCTLET